MAKYTEDAARLLDLVGGKENISAVTHCMTRMRFVLVDEGKADVSAIEALPAAKGTFYRVSRAFPRRRPRRRPAPTRTRCSAPWACSARSSPRSSPRSSAAV